MVFAPFNLGVQPIPIVPQTTVRFDPYGLDYDLEATFVLFEENERLMKQY
jgi:hypothetical protein